MDTRAALRQRPDREQAPRILLRAIAALIVITVALVAWARIADVPPAALPPADTPVVQERSIRLYAEMTGAVQVLSAEGEVIANLTPETGGFIAGVGRSLARVRAQSGVATDAPVRLVRFEDGRLGLRDDFTGWRAELIGFGRDNAAAFAKLLTDR